MMKALPLTPLMTISLTLTIGIIIAKWGYDDFNYALLAHHLHHFMRP
ncbi:MAG: hypothetical protein ACLRYB_11500 [Segatella copri]